MPSPVFNFLKIQFQFGNIDEAKLKEAKSKNLITEEEYEEILTAD